MATIEQSMEELMKMDGAMGCCIVDYSSGMLLGKLGGGVDLDMAGAGNTNVIRAKMETMKTLGITGSIEDILITLESQFHIIRPSATHGGIFIYLVLDKNKGNLALARRKVMSVESALTL